jgi:hypothetical protein
MAKNPISPETRRRVLATARANNGEILLNCSRDKDGHISIRCKRGHISKKSPFTVSRGVWCGEQPCLGEKISKNRAAIAIEKQKNKFKKFCEKHKLRIVKGKYTNQKSKFLVRCESGHDFKINFEPLPKNHPCKACRIKRKEDEARALIEAKGFSLLGIEIPKREQIVCNISCSEGHIWQSKLAEIRRGLRCSECHFLFPDISLANLTKNQKEQLITEAIAPTVKKLGGTVHGSKIIDRNNGKTEYMVDVSCENGHRWETSAYTIKKGHWCSDCNTYNVKETICRTLLEHITDKPFPKKRLNWLINSRGQKMELDGYNKEISIGFEYQGIQHYEFIEFFHNSEKKFKQRQKDDELKRKLCKRNKVHLIEIPYFIPKNELQQFLVSSIQTFAPNLILHPENLEIESIKTGKNAELEKLKQIASDHGGKLISKNYVDSQTKLEFECSKGHRWKATPSSIINSGSWCGNQECVNELLALKVRAKSISKMEELLKEKGVGKIVSVYPREKKQHTLFKLECENGHFFDTDLGRVRNGNWCRHCNHSERGASQRLSIEDVQNTAKERNGRLISQYYLNAQTKLLWECEHGHIWPASANSVRKTDKRKGSWCPVCINKNEGFEGDVKTFLAEEKAAYEKKFSA